MIIKKVGKKPFHNGNRLNGNGNKVRARYGVFNQDGTQVGFLLYNGLYDAYTLDGKTRINQYGTTKLKDMRDHLAKIGDFAN